MRLKFLGVIASVFLLANAVYAGGGFDTSGFQGNSSGGGTLTSTDFTTDVTITNTSPELIFMDSSGTTAYGFHIDTAANQPFQLFTGTFSGTTFSQTALIQAFNSSNQPMFPGIAPTSGALTRCLQIDSTGLVTATSAACSGGGSVSTGTTNTIPKYTNTTTLGNSLITENGTTETYTGTGGLVAPSFTSNGSGAGFSEYTTGALGVSSAGTARIGANTSNVLSLSQNGAAVQAIPACGGDLLCANNLAPTVTKLTLTGEGQLGSQATTTSVANDGVTGTTVNLLAIVQTDGTAIKAATTNTNVPVYIVVAGAGTTGNARLAVSGQASCVMDSTTSNTGGFYVIASTATAGRCHTQSAQPSAYVMGTMISSSTTSGSSATVAVGGSYQTFQGVLSGTSANWELRDTSDNTAVVEHYDTAALYPFELFKGTDATGVAFSQTQRWEAFNSSGIPIFDQLGATVTNQVNQALQVNSLGLVSVLASGPALTTRSLGIPVGSDNAAAVIADADLGPQKDLIEFPYAATITQISVSADAGTPNVIVGRNCGGTRANFLSSALATAANGGRACSKTGATKGYDLATTCSATLQNTAMNPGCTVELVSGTAGGTAKRMSITVHFTVS